jgi:hypothetical protein
VSSSGFLISLYLSLGLSLWSSSVVCSDEEERKRTSKKKKKKKKKKQKAGRKKRRKIREKEEEKVAMCHDGWYRLGQSAPWWWKPGNSFMALHQYLGLIIHKKK